MEMIEKAVRESFHYFEWTHRRIGGEEFPAEVLLTRMVQRGKVVIQATVRDITERKRAESELLESREMLQRVINNIPQHVFWKDRNLNFLGANAAFARSGGLQQPADIIGKSDFDLSWKESAKAYQTDDQIVLKSGVPKLNYEEMQKRPDGSLRWLRSSKLPLVDDAGKIMGVLGIYEDITENKRVEGHVREQAALLDKANDAIYVTALDCTILYWNRGAERTYGWTSAEVLNRKTTELISPDPAAAQALAAILLKQESWSGERRQMTKSGGMVEVFSRLTLVRERAGPAAVGLCDRHRHHGKKAARNPVSPRPAAGEHRGARQRHCPRSQQRSGSDYHGRAVAAGQW